MTDQELVDFYEATLERIATPQQNPFIHEYNRMVGEAERALEAGRNRVKRKRLWRLF